MHLEIITEVRGAVVGMGESTNPQDRVGRISEENELARENSWAKL